ncbi:hypothetical protein [Halocatena marina]|uniref:Uncharacterized protein n=1 Tax=Halocatena marina TaxID=2934937 RepID=A0ABD5YN40_9EURY|nr:hypothetical protein [Halocatena marina]
MDSNLRAVNDANSLLGRIEVENLATCDALFYYELDVPIPNQGESECLLFGMRYATRLERHVTV